MCKPGPGRQGKANWKIKLKDFVGILFGQGGPGRRFSVDLARPVPWSKNVAQLLPILCVVSESQTRRT